MDKTIHVGNRFLIISLIAFPSSEFCPVNSYLKSALELFW